MTFIDESKKELEFTEYDFVAVLLPLLYKNGITVINEDELEKKLLGYYIDGNNKELFANLNRKFNIFRERVSLYDALYKEKYVAGNIMFEQRYSNILYLEYPEDYDFSQYEKALSEDGKKRIRKIAKEIADQLTLEVEFNGIIKIYNINPNHYYLLVSGKKFLSKVSHEIITDGEYYETEFEKDNNKDILYESPLQLESTIALSEKNVIRTKVKDATYVIKQGLSNGAIRFSVLETQEDDYDRLHELARIASSRPAKNLSINKETPHMKKLSLK